LLTGLMLLREGRVPGVWIVATAGEPEPIPDQTGKPTNEFALIAAAFALTGDTNDGRLVRLQLDYTVRLDSACSGTSLVSCFESAGESTVCEMAGLGRIKLGAEPITA
jgi:hypothetical protein